MYQRFGLSLMLTRQAMRKDAAMRTTLAGPSQGATLVSPWQTGLAGAAHQDGKFPPGHRPVERDLWTPVGWDPDLLPNTASQVVMALVEAANAAQVAAVLPGGDLRNELTASAASFVDAVLDDYCGTRWPWPGPPPWAVAIASELSQLANTYQAGFLRDELLRIAGLAMQKAVGHRKA
jgi:hypothetical protein